MNLIKLIDKFNKSAKGKIVGSILAFSMSLVMVVSVCLAYAWFAQNDRVGSNGIQITTTSEEINATYSAYYIRNLDTKAVEKGSQYTNNGIATLDIKMISYDLTFTSTNQYAPVVLRIEVYDMPSKYVPTGNQTKTVSLVFERNSSVSFTSDDELDAYFSSIGQIGCYTNSTLALNASNQTLYDAIINQYRADNNIHKFTTYNQSTELYTKVNSLNVSMSYTAANLKTNSNNKSCLVMYVCFDYNATLAQAYAEQETGGIGTANSLEQKYDMINDISFITVDFN